MVVIVIADREVFGVLIGLYNSDQAATIMIELYNLLIIMLIQI